jgi:hypothetical protein
LTSAGVQPQLVVTASDDRYEQEADRVAELVCGPRQTAATAVLTQTTAQIATPAATLPRISPFVQREAVGESAPADVESAPEPGLEARLVSRASAGRPLSVSVRERMEDRFGVRFGTVRVHTGSEADRMAGEIEALAFTHGRDIYFAAGAYAPGTPAGDRLLAHELTHVVQQAGGMSSTAGTAGIQRARIRGPAFHAGTESRFIAANKGKGLLTEAPLPGATTSTSFDFEKVGFPDLYLSDMPNTAIGVRGKWETGKDVNPSDDPNKKRTYVELLPFDRKAKGESGAVTYSPKPQGETQPFTSEFPNRIEVGDIKPIWMLKGHAVVDKPSEGTAQLANYRTGIAEFVRLAALDHKVNRGNVGRLGVLTGLAIPPELDYRAFDKENKSPSPNIIGAEGMAGRRRYWMFEPPGTGLYYYFSLPHPNPSPLARAKLEETFKQLEPVRGDLRTPDDGIHSKLNLPKLPKRRPGAPGRPKATLSTRPAAARPQAAAHAVQRKETPRVKKDWAALGKAWEAKRAAWDAQFAKPFLASPEAKALDERVTINNAIGLKDDASSGSIAEQGKHLHTIELWSGRTGKALGALRFLLGGTFDKVAAAFDWIRGKLSGFWQKLTGAGAPQVGGGWRKTLVNLLVKAVKLGFRELVSVFFELCANCLEGIISKVIQRFTQDISEELQKHLEELQQQFETYHTLIKTEFEKRFGSWDQFIEDLSTAQKWANILFTMEGVLRLGVQAVACLSPPALGCLWGLVVQVGFDVALGLIMGTEWFQEHVINHPSVRDLVKQFAGPTIRSLIADTLRGVGLEEYAKGVEPCTKVKELEEPPIPPVDPISEDELRKRRAEWEQANRPQMLQDLKFLFHTKPGQPATEDELEALVAAMARSGKKPEELERIIKSTPKWSNGKFDIGAIRQRLAGAGDKPGGVAPGGAGRPDVGITKPVAVPGGPRIEVGPRVFQPPPGSPPGEQGPTLPGAGFRF